MTGTQSMALRLLLAVGLGLCTWGGYQWYQVETPTEEELRLSVEANFYADLARMQAQQPGRELDLSEEWKTKHRQAIREEIQAMVEHEKATARSWFLAGLAVLIFSLGRMFAAPLFRGRDTGDREQGG